MPLHVLTFWASPHTTDALLTHILFDPSTHPISSPTSQDEALLKMNPEKLRKLKPFFRAAGGTVTAGNSSPITDGAAAVVLASQAAVQRLKLKVRHTHKHGCGGEGGREQAYKAGCG